MISRGLEIADNVDTCARRGVALEVANANVLGLREGLHDRLFVIKPDARLLGSWRFFFFFDDNDTVFTTTLHV